MLFKLSAVCKVTHLLGWQRRCVLKTENSWFEFILLFQFHNRKSMFATLHSDINSLKSGFLYLTGEPSCKKSRSAKVKDGIINLILRNYLVDRYMCYANVVYQ